MWHSDCFIHQLQINIDNLKQVIVIAPTVSLGFG